MYYSAIMGQLMLLLYENSIVWSGRQKKWYSLNSGLLKVQLCLNILQYYYKIFSSSMLLVCNYVHITDDFPVIAKNWLIIWTFFLIFQAPPLSPSGSHFWKMWTSHMYPSRPLCSRGRCVLFRIVQWRHSRIL